MTCVKLNITFLINIFNLNLLQRYMCGTLKYKTKSKNRNIFYSMVKMVYVQLFFFYILYIFYLSIQISKCKNSFAGRMFTYPILRNLMKYSVCTAFQGKCECIVSATIHLIIHRRTRIIIVQFFCNIARTIVIRATTLPSASVIPSNVQFFLHHSHEHEVYRSIPHTYSFIELADWNKMYMTYTR